MLLYAHYILFKTIAQEEESVSQNNLPHMLLVPTYPEEDIYLVG